MAKKVKVMVKLQLLQEKPLQPLRLVQRWDHGINIADFVKQFNDKTGPMGDTVIPVEMTIFDDRSFTFILKTPPAANLIMKAAGIAKGSGSPLATKVGKIKASQVREIATEKMVDLNATSLEAAEKIIRGTARSMGVEVTD